MRHGRKSAATRFDGDKATVVAETEAGVILATDVQPANVADREPAVESVTAAAACAGQPVACVLGDTAYGDCATRTGWEALGAEVVAKVPPGTRRGMFSLHDFTVEDNAGVATCPAGQCSLKAGSGARNRPGVALRLLPPRLRTLSAPGPMHEERSGGAHPAGHRPDPTAATAADRATHGRLPAPLPPAGGRRAPHRASGPARRTASPLPGPGEGRLPGRSGSGGGQPDPRAGRRHGDLRGRGATGGAHRGLPRAGLDDPPLPARARRPNVHGPRGPLRSGAPPQPKGSRQNGPFSAGLLARISHQGPWRARANDRRSWPARGRSRIPSAIQARRACCADRR